MKKTRKEQKEKIPVAQMTCIYMSFGPVPHPCILSCPIPMCCSFIWHSVPPNDMYLHLVGACASSSSSYPISLLPVSTLQAVAHSGSWGCCCAVVVVLVDIVIVVVMVVASL